MQEMLAGSLQGARAREQAAESSAIEAGYNLLLASMDLEASQAMMQAQAQKADEDAAQAAKALSLEKAAHEGTERELKRAKVVLDKAADIVMHDKRDHACRALRHPLDMPDPKTLVPYDKLATTTASRCICT